MNATGTQITNNRSALNGGGVYDAATVTLMRVNLSNNTAMQGSGGGLPPAGY